MPPPRSAFTTLFTPHLSRSNAFPRTCPRASRRVLVATATTESAESDGKPSYELAPGEIGVRFINTPSGNDVVAAATPGDQLLHVGDGVGVQIPRACQSGLCGSCTCDIVDESAEGGVQTVRACQTSVMAVDGKEMVVDVSRMKDFKGRQRDPMARFDNLDTEYVAGAAPRKRGTWLTEVECDECDGKGDVECYACDGEGIVEQGQKYECTLCAGTGGIRCADCQGMGVRQVRR